MVLLSNYLSYLKLHFKNYFKYMGTNIVLILHIYSASILFLYQLVNWSVTIYLLKLITTTIDQLLVISFVKVKKSKVNYTVLFWNYGNEFEHCQWVLNRFVTIFNWTTVHENLFYSTLRIRAKFESRNWAQI